MGAGVTRDGVDRSPWLHALRILPLPTHSGNITCCRACQLSSFPGKAA